MGLRVIGWGLVALLVAVGIVGLLPATSEAQACAGSYEQGKGSNFGACAAGAAAPAASTASLYRRLGGREGIALVVGDFVASMAADNRVNARFKQLKPAEVEKFKTNLADQICDATGGPCSYVGKDMPTAHKDMKITEAEWNATVENLGKALDKHKVPAKEKQELVGILAPMKGDIVGR
ncbi:MAG: group 1 truncated hemoglobin [Candidatus Rokubacteria bacterium]|nr:group 1 truncated hemoglobin [Candidatus Rokubacteria bacterium]